MELGKNISSQLTKDIREGYVVSDPQAPKNLNKRKDLDLLLNDWGIHHLHLSNKIDVDGFAKRQRTKEEEQLLFVVFTRDHAFLLDLASHGSWTDTRLVEIAVRNWPQMRLFHSLDVLPGPTQFSGDQIKEIRGAGLSTHIVVDGSVYISSTLGISSAGTSSIVALEANRLIKNIALHEKMIHENPDYLHPSLEKMGAVWPDKPEIHLVFVDDVSSFAFALREEKTHSLIGIQKLPW
jgi:hypothetical protein